MDSPSARTESELVQAAQAGDQQAIAQLVDQNRGAVRLCVKKLRPASPDAAEDLFQDGVLGVLDAIKRFDPSIARDRKSSFFTYALWWIRLRTQQGAKRIYGHPLSQQSDDLAWVEARQSTPEPYDLLGNLPPDERQVIILAYGLDGTGKIRHSEQISRLVPIAPREVRRLVRSALDRLRRTLLISPGETK